MIDRAQYHRDKAKARRQSMTWQERFDYPPGGVWSVIPPEPRPVDPRPIYDPRRDGEPVWTDATAYMLGDPPLTRSALCRKKAECK